VSQAFRNIRLLQWNPRHVAVTQGEVPMKSLIPLSLMLALSVPAFASAQPSDADGGMDMPPMCACEGHGPGQGHGHGPGGRRGPPDAAQMQQFFNQRLETMTRELSLRPNQVQQIRAIFAEALAQLQAMQANRPAPGTGRADPELRRQHMQARFAIEERVAAVLDRQQLLRMLASRHQHMLEGRGDGPGHGGPDGAPNGPRGQGRRGR